MKPSRHLLIRLPYCWTWLAVLLAAGMAGESRGTDAVAWQKLISQSPFLAAGPTAASAPVGEARLEFRGFYTMDGQTFFRVDDPVRNRGAWLVLGQPEDGMLVKQHDPATETIIVECHGQTQTLTWRAGKVINAPSDMPPPGVDLVPSRYIRNGLRNRSLYREEVEPQHTDNEWFREFVKKYGPPVYLTK